MPTICSCTNIGRNGGISDGGVYRNCNLSRALEEKCLNIPEPTLLRGTQSLFPYVIVADDAFPPKEYIMKPFSQIGLTPERKMFSRVVENAFGILANRFRVFITPMELVPEKIEVITMACCTLHSFLRSHVSASSVYAPSGTLDTEDPETHAPQLGEWHCGPESTVFFNH